MTDYSQVDMLGVRLLHINVKRFRGGLVFKAHRLCVSLNSRLESNKEEKCAVPICQLGCEKRPGLTKLVSPKKLLQIWQLAEEIMQIANS